MVTPGQTITPPPSQTLSPMVMGGGGLPLGPARLGLERVGGGEQLDVRADLDVVADRDAGDVERDEAEVDEGAGADVQLVAVVAVKRRADLDAFADRSEQLFEQAAGAASGSEGDDAL